MIHFNNKTTLLMDMPAEEKNKFLKDIDLETTEF